MEIMLLLINLVLASDSPNTVIAIHLLIENASIIPPDFISVTWMKTAELIPAEIKSFGR